MVTLIRVFSNKSLSDYANLINESIARRELIVVIGSCEVDYTGRGESKLTDGDRIVIIKSDGSIQIHRPEGYRPVNWQPDTSFIEARLTEEKLVLTAIRDKPREILNITFNKIYLLIKGKLIDKGEFIMYLNESDIRDLIFFNPWLVEKGLRITGREKDVGAGAVDLIGVDSEGRPVLIEIKRATATRESVLQLYRYVEGFTKLTGSTPRGVLIAPSFTTQALDALIRLNLEYREVDLKKLWLLKKKESIKNLSLDEFVDRSKGGEE